MGIKEVLVIYENYKHFQCSHSKKPKYSLYNNANMKQLLSPHQISLPSHTVKQNYYHFIVLLIVILISCLNELVKKQPFLYFCDGETLSSYAVDFCIAYCSNYIAPVKHIPSFNT